MKTDIEIEHLHKEKSAQSSSILKSKNGARWINYDIIAGATALSLGFLLSPYETVQNIKPGFYAMILLYGIVLATVCRLCELPRPGYDFHISRYDILSSGILAVLFALLTFFFLALLMAYPLKGRYIIINSGFISYILVCLPRIILTEVSNRTPMKLGLWGTNQLTELFLKRFGESDYFKVEGLLDSSPSEDTRLKYKLNEIDSENTKSIDCVIICSNTSPTVEQTHFLMTLPMYGVEVLNKGAFIEKYFRVISLDYLNVHWMASFPTLTNDSTSLFMKRTVDIICSICLISLTLPFLPLVALAIKLDSNGDVFYSQLRVGRYNKNFKIYKFRTMVKDAEKNGVQWATTNDLRITRLGQFLRRSRIDELPQLWNVLKGEMSMVGPRPERPEFEQELIPQLPLYERRHLIPPGITGWAQIRYRYAASFDDTRKKLEHDLYYIKHMSFVFDLKIIMKTIIMVMKGSR
ncbi:MAG: sugar transferase [Lentisphaeraceae bacterium]|nr:sugar transferase [Lentisphaeraceae bacterium]